jgi:hypothetical protein
MIKFAETRQLCVMNSSDTIVVFLQIFVFVIWISDFSKLINYL